MSRRKPDVYERDKQMYWDAYHRSPLLKEKYPQVGDITIDTSYKDYDMKDGPEPQQIKFAQESKAFFRIECPYRECISGGFDLSAAIDELISSHMDKLDGTITCQGWQDKERVNKHRCFLKLNYAISTTYKT
jgi:hypothetical protein